VINLDKNIKIYVAGHNGMVGSAILRKLKTEGYEKIIFRTSKELDLTNQLATEVFFASEMPDCVILAAAKVGGIGANIKEPAEFLMENLKIQTNVIDSSFKNNVKKLIFLGSSCIYPKEAKQPLKEEYLLTGKLESTNEGYAIAKIAGIKACEYYNKEYKANYISIMPPNLYGINDNFDPIKSHIVAALIRKMHEAKLRDEPNVEIWGSGNQYRELMFVDDLADAVIFIMENYNEAEFINVGTGIDSTVKEIAEVIKEIIGYKGHLIYDKSKPDGMSRKLLDVTRINALGWKSETRFEEGIKATYDWYLNNLSQGE
jgi:GDP-L-fucose synthase